MVQYVRPLKSADRDVGRKYLSSWSYSGNCVSDWSPINSVLIWVSEYAEKPRDQENGENGWKDCSK